MSKVYGFCDMNCKYEVPTKEEFDALVDEIAYSPVEANADGVFTLDQVGIEYVMYRKNKYLNNWGIKMVIHNSLLGDIDINPDNTYVNTMDGITYTLNAVPLDGEYIRYKVSNIEYKAVSGGTSSGGGTEHLVYNIQYKTENTSWQTGQVAMSVSTSIGKDNIKYGGIKITQGVSEVKIPPVVERNFAVLESTMFDSMKKFEIAIAETLSSAVKVHIVNEESDVIYNKTQYNDVYVGDVIDDMSRILKVEGNFSCTFIDSNDDAVIKQFNVKFDYAMSEESSYIFMGKGEPTVYTYLSNNEVLSVYLSIDNGNLHFYNGMYYNYNENTYHTLTSLTLNRMTIYFK